MKTRCFNENNRAFPDYGGRGILVCTAWKNSFEKCLADMGSCPPGLTIERLDNARGYEPGNCEWRSQEDQNNNRRDNLKIECRGEIRAPKEWSRISGIPAKSICYRLRRGYPPETAIFQKYLKFSNLRFQ